MKLLENCREGTMGVLDREQIQQNALVCDWKLTYVILHLVRFLYLCDNVQAISLYRCPSDDNNTAVYEAVFREAPS